MGLFRKRSRPVPKVDTPLGVFAFDHNWWVAEHQTPTGPIRISVIGESFDPAVVPKVQHILSDLERWSDDALQHVRNNQPESLQGNGDVTLEAADITDICRGGFNLGYGYTEWPDGTLTVVFKDGKPVDIWEDD